MVLEKKGGVINVTHSFLLDYEVSTKMNTKQMLMQLAISLSFMNERNFSLRYKIHLHCQHKTLD